MLYYAMLAAEYSAGRGANIGLAHEAFADEKGLRSGSLQAKQIAVVIKAAFGH